MPKVERFVKLFQKVTPLSPWCNVSSFCSRGFVSTACLVEKGDNMMTYFEMLPQLIIDN